mmetsp:Transcript_25263/g.32957  ORF Transcript_25263/g.32957 Transcript_25263/m.32957 type:complete len:230 (+) Transcript_25263:1481-2170(+)
MGSGGFVLQVGFCSVFFRSCRSTCNGLSIHSWAVDIFGLRLDLERFLVLLFELCISFVLVAGSGLSCVVFICDSIASRSGSGFFWSEINKSSKMSKSSLLAKPLALAFPQIAGALLRSGLAAEGSTKRRKDPALSRGDFDAFLQRPLLRGGARGEAWTSNVSRVVECKGGLGLKREFPLVPRGESSGEWLGLKVSSTNPPVEAALMVLNGDPSGKPVELLPCWLRNKLR